LPDKKDCPADANVVGISEKPGKRISFGKFLRCDFNSICLVKVLCIEDINENTSMV